MPKTLKLPHEQKRPGLYDQRKDDQRKVLISREEGEKVGI